MKKIIVVIMAALFVLNGIVLAEPSKPQKKIDSYDLLILTPQIFMDELQPLVDHKNQHQLHTIMIPLHEIYDESPGRDHSEKIKYYIKNALESWGIQYVLLIGGKEPSLLKEKWFLPVRAHPINPMDRY